MVVIKLYGVLETVACRTVRVHARDLDDALRALHANFPKLARVLRDLRISMLVNGQMISVEDCLRPMKADRIDIMPVIGGNGPAVFILAGAALNAGATAIGSYLAGTALFTGITAATISASVAQFGIALILGGISQILFKPPSMSLGGAERPESTPSYVFNGAVNTVSQGNVVPVGFGRMKVGSQVIAANIQTWDIPIAPPPVEPAPPPPPPAPPEMWVSADYIQP